MPLETSAQVHNAHDVLRSIRRVKTQMQLQETYGGFLAFIRTSRQKMLERAARAEAARTRSSPKDPLRTAASASPSHDSLEAQGAMSQLKQVSLLAGAFCRRVEYVLRSTYAYADVDDAMPHGPATVRVNTCMAELAAELRLFNTPALNRFLSVAGKDEAPTWSAAGSSPVDCTLSYATGDLNDYCLYRRLRAHDYLQQLLAQPQCNTASITRVIVTINETLSAPVDAFELCAGDEAVETTCVVTPLRDPISQTVMRTPARGSNCVHLEMFDVENFVKATQQRSLGTVDVGGPCPLCSQFISLAAIRVDRRAMEAMEEYEKFNGDSSDTAARVPLDADCALEWNTERRTVRVVHGKRSAMDASTTALTEDGNDADTPRKSSRSEPAGTATKKRRIEIGGHVLYAD
ncbi:hypothetical protein ABB37_04855 [Leptomonas pyrrhocoris]|uniref:SP-RING-type domain-containing protein n=1 Tax=Leptomonas pyrrhocoris TaxID=157538 RepID=A0A0N0VFH5_LEPPY|nr:hypothetical protein ABB37_04855 [Leptomonas pyrrhocoris]XP_015659114.1 hypothetical protein ABB37_04855 [Leptomonas pyrrhocoris]KPA80674.1 hypothetical protein ABB37_04855 [Leptomonas pyrrhocoris]KPA80675.1 hypothetical protein ABB37_04855 [Leptomonas pyrrhocoris]|eukprot:XP_015659113.1 hypothetical protein ABB37_04855 [Leptomonas pyrrhocoris]